MTNEEAIYLLRNTAWLAPTLEPIDEAIEMACEALRKADTPQTEQTEPKKDLEITRNSLRSDCIGCRFVGWYDTEFPCVNCVRKNRDYYDSKI